MKGYRIFSLTLALTLLCGCTAVNNGGDDTGRSAGGDNENGYFSDRAELDDGLSGYNGIFENYTYRVVASDGNDRYVIAEDGMSDNVDKAVHARNLAVEERFGCGIEVVLAGTEKESRTFITNSVMSNEDLFDVAYHHVVSQGMLAMNDYYMNWYDIPAVDFTKPWWSVSTTKDLSYDGSCYIAIGDFALTALSNAYCVYFNKSDAEKYQLPNLYDVVKSGDWTIDRLLELTRDVYDDLNHNNTVDDGDYFGYVSDCTSNITAYLWAFDNPVMRVGDDGIETVFKTEKLVDIVEKLVDATSRNEIRVSMDFVNASGGKMHWYGIEQFSKGQALFSNGYVAQSLTYLRDMEDAYGILPYPKWDSEQENYYTMADGNHTSLAVPKTVAADRLEFIGVITEALCAESYKTLVPVYYEEALKLKGTRDDESMEMIDFVVDSCVYDMGYVYDSWSGFSFYLEQLVRNGDTNFESFYAKNSGKALAHYEKVADYFTFGEIK